MKKFARVLFTVAGLAGMSRLESIARDLSFPSEGVLGYWKFDENLGNAQDSSGNGNNLENNGGTFTSGKIGNSAWTSTGYLKNEDFYPLGIGNFTLAFWMKESASAGAECVVSSSSTWISPGNYGIAKTSDHKIGFWDSAGTGMVSTSDVDDDKWHHIVFLRDTTGLNQMRLYVDGVNEAAKTISGGFVRGIFVGGGNDGLPNYSGLIDELGVWSRSLSSNEVSVIYNNGYGLSVDGLTNVVIKSSVINTDTNNNIRASLEIYSPLGLSFTLQRSKNMEGTNWEEVFSYTPPCIGATKFSFPLTDTNVFYRIKGE